MLQQSDPAEPSSPQHSDGFSPAAAWGCELSLLKYLSRSINCTLVCSVCWEVALFAGTVFAKEHCSSQSAEEELHFWQFV